MPDGIPFDHADGYWRYGGWDNTDLRTGKPRCRAEVREQNDAIRALTSGTDRVIYAIQFPGGTVKIGCTRNLTQRLKSYDDHEILSFRPGTLDDEEAIHKSLRPHLHHAREWYNPTSEVLAVVNDMRDHFGLPHIAA